MQNNSRFYINYTPELGSTIEAEARNAIHMAKANNKPVVLHFNSAALVVTTGSDPDDISAQYRQHLREKMEEFRNSPEGRASQQDQDAKIQARTQIVRQLVDDLPQVLGRGLTETIKWLQKYAISADHIAVEPQARKVLDALKAAGYKTNDCSGDHFAPNNKEIFGRYIIGQAMVSLEAGGAPHPVTANFAKSYLDATVSARQPAPGKGPCQ